MDDFDALPAATLPFAISLCFVLGPRFRFPFEDVAAAGFFFCAEEEEEAEEEEAEASVVLDG